MKILLCEDNPADLEKAREQIEAAAETYPEESMLEICQTAEACRAYLKSEVPDLVFMDIFMAETSGVDLAREIRSLSTDAKIVFLTSSNEFAAESYEVGAMDYILKPPTQSQVKKVFENYMKTQKSQRRYILVKRGRDEVRIEEAGILYVRTIGNETSIHTKTGVIRAYYPLREIEKQLDVSRFLKVRKGLITSMDYIES
ncbi:MAG: LytR/AlgR family response regulator transcription factor, partial [Eubacterium callanderi]